MYIYYIYVYISYIYVYTYTYIYVYNVYIYFPIFESEQAPQNFQDRVLSKDLRPCSYSKVHFKPIQIFYILKDFLTVPKTIVGSFQFHIVDISTCLKKTMSTKNLEQLRFLSRRIHLVRKKDALKMCSYTQYGYINLILINLKAHFATFVNSMQATTLVF